MKIKAIHSALQRTCLSALWLLGAVFMLTNFVAYEENPGGEHAVRFAIHASVCALITIAGLCIHAYLVD